jgi:cell wall-associated NlpC family hydrolase
VIDLRKKKLLTLTLCMTLAMAAPAYQGYGGQLAGSSAAAASDESSDQASEKTQEEAAESKKAKSKEETKEEKKSGEDTKSADAKADSGESKNTEAAEPAEASAKEAQPKAEEQAPATEAQTQPPMTEAQTQAPATEAQTQAPATEAQTQAPATEAQTQAPATEAQTQASATEAQTQAPVTEAQTQAPATEAQTQASATEAQTQPPATEGETQAPATEAQPSATETQTPATEGETLPPATETQTQLPDTDAETSPSETEGETQAPVTEDQTQLPDTDAETLPSEADSGLTGEETETEAVGTEQQTDSEELPDTEEPEESESETESEIQTTEKKDREKESETEPEKDEQETGKSPYATNAELLAHQHIVTPPEVKSEFRFTQAEKVYAIVNVREGCNVYESQGETSRVVGELPYYGLCYILADRDSDWIYIESGNVRGFVQAENLAVGETADRIVKVRGEDELPTARLCVARTENAAYTYTKTTVKEVIAEKEYAIALTQVNVYEQKKDSARVTGTLAEGGLCYILADDDNDWIYVESDRTRGFVKAEELLTGKEAEQKVEEKGEGNFALASVLIEPEDNKACYYTLTSVKAASQSAMIRESMVDFALQFVGNPYVWGGTSLTAGADCSGFVQTIYAYYGYSLPRVACDQAGYGMQIPVASALPGDLIFYAKDGYVYHVSMYIGNGQVIHAASRKLGIITSGISGNAVWATRVISD